MKPSQFLYSESIKDQKAQKANVTKSIGELKPLPKTANPPKEQNSSMIYSLVNLPFKEGQNDQVIFPQALISQHMKVDPKVVVGKNTEIARSLKKLKPLESLDSAPEQPKPSTAKLGIPDQQLQGPKLQTYLKVLNDLTNGLFKKTQSQLLFGSVEQKVGKNTALCVLRIQQLKFFNEYNQKNDKIPALFSWEALYRKKSLMKTTPKEFDAAQQDLLDFLYPRNSYESVDIVLWKIKNNDEKYIGQFDLSNEDYQNSKEVLDFKSKYITEKFLEKEMFKSMKQTKSYIGNVRFQLIQLADDKIPLNKHSGIPGSPRTEEEKARHRIIDAAMAGQEYRWSVDDQERIVIQKIDSITKEIIAETTIETVEDECGNLLIVFETKYADPETSGRSRPTSRQMRKKQFEANMNLVMELDKTGVFTEVQGTLRGLSRQGKLTRKAIDDALQAVGCTANQLLLTPCGEFGDCFMDFLINTDDLPGVLEAMQEIKIVGEDELNLESISNNLFQNIGQHMRKNVNLKSTIDFIKALEKKPEVGLLIFNYSYASENVLSATPPFLQNFDSRNYEHVMILSKLNKLIAKFKVDTKFTRALKKAHTEAKKAIYFEIPCFPKDLDLDDKADSLQLKGLGQNVLHEVVRRQKWNKSHVIFEKYPEWFFVADEQDHTPFSLMLEQAPFDVIKALFAAYPEQLQNIFNKFDPNENMFESRVPKKEEEKKEEKQEGEGENQEEKQQKKDEPKEPSEDDDYAQRKEKAKKRNAFNHFKEQKEYRKNLLHSLLLNTNVLNNSDATLSDLKDVLRSLELLVNQSNENNFEVMKTQKLRAGDFTPLGLYLEIIRSKLKRKLDRVQREISATILICQMLTPNIDEEENNQAGAEQQPKSTFQWTLENQIVISQVLAKFPEHIFERLDEERFAKQIQWIPTIEDLKTIRYINLPFRALVKHKQQHKLFSLIQQMNEDIRNIQYNAEDPEADDNKKLFYYFQIQVLMLMEIRNLRSQKLDQVATQILSQLKEFTLVYPQLLVEKMPRNITDSYYPFKHQYKGWPQSILEMLNMIKYNILLTEIPIQYLDKLNNANLGEALFRCKDQEPLRDFIRLFIAKYKPESEEEAEQHGLFKYILDPSLIFGDQAGIYVKDLNKTQIESILLTYKEKIFPILPKLLHDTNIGEKLLTLILRSFQNRKSVGVTQQQVALWIRSDYQKIGKFWVNKFIQHFRATMSLQQIHTLIDLDLDKNTLTYPNQAKIYPYIQAQGRNWASILELRKFAAALKDNITYIDIERTLKCVAVNGQYEKMELVLPYVKDSALIKSTIHFVSKIAGLQIFNQKEYYLQGDPKKKKTQPDNNEGKEDEEENKEEAGNGGDDGGEGGDDGAPKLATIAKPVQSQSETKKKEDSKKESASKRQGDTTKKEQEPVVNDLSDFYIRCYDPTVYFFKTSIKEKKEKFKIDQIKFPEALDQLRTPLSLQDQLKEMSPAIQLEIDDFLRSQFPKCNIINLSNYEKMIEKDVVMFRYLKNWKSSLQRQNLRSVFTPYDSGAGLQSYKKTLTQLVKQFQRYGMPMCESLEEFQQTLQVFMTYGILNMEQIIFQVASSKLTPKEKNSVLVNLLKTVLGNSYLHPQKEYQVRKNKEIHLQLAQHYQSKNANTYLSQVNRIIKSINVKQFDEELTKDFESSILTTITTIFSVLKPEILNDVKVLHFKLASEILQRLDQIDIKTVFQEQLVNIAKIIKTRQLKDKQLLALANKYNPERIEQAFKPSHKDVITLFKKQKLEEALSTDIVTYLQKYTDVQCEEIVTELFKLPYDKSFKEELISKFNNKLFEALIFLRRYRTYNKLINDILLKQLLKGKEDEQAKFIVNINGNQTGSKIQQNSQLANSQVNQPSIAQAESQQPDQDAPKDEQQQEEDPDSKDYSIPQLALFFNFYEYFDTLHRLRIKIGPLEQFSGNRFRLQSNEQLQVVATQYEQQGLNYISNCIKMLRYLRLNHYNGKNNQEYLESSLITAFVTKGNSRWLSQSTNLIQEYLKISERSIPFWNESLIEKKQTINFARLKINGIERGVKFCIASNYSPGDKGDITNDDIRKTPVKKPIFTIDQYVENLALQSTPRLDNQILNDPEFTSVLNKLVFPYKQPEYLVDKIELFDTVKNFQERDESIFYYLVNFPTFWYEEKIPKENLLNRYLFNDFELGIIVLRSVLQLEPKMSDQVLDLYFLSLKEEAKGAEQEEEANQEEKEESEYEEYEVEVTDDEAEIEQNQQEEPQSRAINAQAEKKPDPDQGGPRLVALNEIVERPPEDAADQAPGDEAPQARAPQAEQVQAAPEGQQAPQQPKVKKTKKVMQRRKIQKGDKPQQWVEPKTSLNKLLQDSCNSLQYFQIFLQLLLFASTNEEAFRLVQKYFIQYELVSSLTTPAEIDPVRKARLIKDGFKEPFNQQFLEQMESKAKELKNQQIDDLKHIQEVLSINEKRRHSEQSEVYQVLLRAILKQSQVEAFNGFIGRLLNSAPFKLLTKHKKQVFSHSLEKDSKLQLELRNYFAEVEKIQLAPDVIVKFFENSKQVQIQSPANDKWVNILYILKYCSEISKQVKQFSLDVENQKEKLTSYRSTVCSHYVDNKYVEQGFDVDLKYSFKFKVANKFEPLIYEYKIENNPEEPDSNTHVFNFELTFNMVKNNPADSPFPTAQLSQKYSEEVFKTIDTLYYDNYINCINELCSYQQLKVAQISGSDNIDYIQLKTKLTKENFREYIELHYQNNFFLDDTIKQLQTYENLLEGQEVNNLKILTQLREGIIVSESNEFTQPVKINNQDWNLYSERMRPDIKLKYQDKLYPVPYSNYQPRQRNTQYKQSIQVDQSFPELYPLVNLQVYQYIPDVMTEEQFSQKYDSLATIQQACYDLNSYAQSLDEFISSSPSEEELQNLREVAPQVVSWPIIRVKVKREKGYTEQYKFVHSQEAHPLYMIEYLYRNLQFKIDAPLKFTFNVLSVTEMIVFKLTRILQQTTGKKCKLQTTISIIEEWTLLKKILLKIADLLQGNELDKFKFYYVEFNEVHQNSVYQLKSNKFEGLDTIFRFGQANFFVHSNVLIIRLNFAVISENATGLVTMKNPKLRSYESSHLLFKEDKDLRGYISQIVTLEDMLKQIFTKK